MVQARKAVLAGTALAQLLRVRLLLGPVAVVGLVRVVLLVLVVLVGVLPGATITVLMGLAVAVAACVRERLARVVMVWSSSPTRSAPSLAQQAEPKRSRSRTTSYSRSIRSRRRTTLWSARVRGLPII